MARLQLRKRTKCFQVPPELIRRSQKILKQQKSQESVGPIIRSKKGQAHRFIMNQVDEEDLSKDSEDNNNSKTMLGKIIDCVISAKPESEECIYALTNDKEIIEPSNIIEALQDPIWKKPWMIK